MDKIIIHGIVEYKSESAPRLKEISTLYNENMTIEEYKLNFEKQTKEEEDVDSAELVKLRITENDEHGKMKVKTPSSKDPVFKDIYERKTVS